MGQAAWAIIAGLGTLLLGACCGALVNALADRVVGVDEPIWNARQCHKCLLPLPHARLFAVPDLFTRRVCGSCGQAASLRRPLAQVTLAVLAPIALWRALGPSPVGSALPGWSLFLLAVAALTALTFIFVVDLEHRLIFDLSIFPLLALILGVVAAFDRGRLLALVIPALGAGLLFLLFYGLGWLLYHEEALGFGDVKLALLVGALVGWSGITATLGATVVGAAIVSALLLASGSAERRTFIPFGVFMVAAAAGCLLVIGLPW